MRSIVWEDAWEEDTWSAVWESPVVYAMAPISLTPDGIVILSGSGFLQVIKQR